MKVLAITQARMGSTRLPGKVLKTINGRSLLEIHLERILKAKNISQLLVATTTEDIDSAIAEVAKKCGLPFYRGSLKNVLDRYYQAAKSYSPDWVVRLTSDCPLIDPALIDTVVETAIEKGVDYCSNVLEATFPDGMDIEVFKFSALEKAWREAVTDPDKEHVTTYIRNHSDYNNGTLFTAHNILGEPSYENVRLTVDEQSDFDVISLLVEKLGTDKNWKTYADYYVANKDVNTLNKRIKRNEGYNNSLNNTI